MASQCKSLQLNPNSPDWSLYISLQRYLREWAICTMTSFSYYDQNPFRFSFHISIWWSQWGLNNKRPNLHKKAKSWRILVVVVKWRHHANGLIKDQKHFPFSDHFFNSHNLFSSLYIDVVKRKLILVTLWTERVTESLNLVDHSQWLNLSKFSPPSFFNLPQLQCWLQNSFRGP